MSYKIKYSKEAIAELNKAFFWYRSKDLELGQRFKSAFRKVRLNLKENPEMFTKIGVNHRRAILSSSFPYTVHYFIDKKTKTIKIAGIFHQSKNLETIQEQIKLQKIHDLRQGKNQKLQQRLNQLEKIRQKKELDKGLEKDQGLEL